MTVVWPSRGRPARIDVDRIVQAARALAEQGVDALTMGALAEALGVTPMPAYHVRNREHLLAFVLDAALGDVEVPEHGRWNDRIRALHRAIVAELDRYPALFPIYRAGSHPEMPSARRLLDAYLRILREGGFTEEHAALAYTGLYFLAMGVVLHRADNPAPSPVAGLRDDDSHLTGDDHADFALDTYIAGLERLRRAR